MACFHAPTVTCPNCVGIIKKKLGDMKPVSPATANRIAELEAKVATLETTLAEWAEK